MNPNNLQCLLQIHVEARLNDTEDHGYGVGQVPPVIYPFLPNRPPIFEVLWLYPEFIDVFGRPKSADFLNVRKLENKTGISPFNLNTTVPGGSWETAIEYVDEDEPNPDSMQNTPFTNVVLPCHQEDPLPDLVDLGQNPFDVPLMNPPEYWPCKGAK
ncbi:hypothetical protein PQX77_019426 [Marasmius sp. AFHP31]|nr:hypothetical protein PQX77_019426 [Marasmius sp. AFHP31]